MIRNKKNIIKLCIRILLKGDTLKRVEFDEIIMVGTGDKLLLTRFIWLTKMIDWQTCTLCNLEYNGHCELHTLYHWIIVSNECHFCCFTNRFSTFCSLWRQFTKTYQQMWYDSHTYSMCSWNFESNL